MISLNKRLEETQKEKKIYYLSVYLILIFFILISISISIYIRLSPYPSQSIISYDIVGNLIQAKRFIATNSISQNSYYAWINAWRYDPKPIGFPILSAEFVMLSGVSLYSVGYLGLIWYTLEILLVFLLSWKIFKNKNVASLTSFLMLTYLTGPDNQGPLYAHYANIDLILFLIVFISIFYIKNVKKSIILSSFALAGIIITHRPGLIFIFVFMFMMLLYPVILLIINRKEELKMFLKFRTLPYISSFIFGWDIAVVYWHHIKLENILLFGYSPFAITLGSMPEFLFDLLKKVDMNIYLSILILMNIIIIGLLWNLFIRGEKSLGPHTIEVKPSDVNPHLIFLTSTILPLMFAMALIYIGNLSGIPFGFSVEYIKELWLNFAREAYENDTVRILKQIFYLWHWNLFAMVFLIPSFMLIMKKIRMNINLGLLSLSVIIILGILWYTQISWGYISVLERLYLYFAPFVYVTTAYAVIIFLRCRTKRKSIRKVFLAYSVVIILVTAGIFTMYSLSFKEPTYSDKHIETYTFTHFKINESYFFTAEGHDIQRGNLYDGLRYRNVYPWWGEIPPRDLLNKAKKHGVAYIYSDLDPRYLPLTANPQNLDFDNYCWKIYATEHHTLYYVW